MESYRKWLFYNAEEMVEHHIITTKLQQGNLKAVSNGSYKQSHNVATAAWTILDENYKPMITGTPTVLGNNATLSTFYKKNMYA